MTYPTDEEMAVLKALWEAEERMLTPLPWCVEFGTQYDGTPSLVSIIGANGDTVADNQRYYPHPVKPVDMEYIVRAVNAHEALIAAGQALSNCAYNLEQNSALATRDRVALKMSCEAWDAALAAARK